MIARCVPTLFALLVLLNAMCAQAISGQSPEREASDNSNWACIEKLKLPVYPLLARQARLAGTLTVFVDIGADGTVERIGARSKLNNDRAQGVMFSPVEKTIRSSVFKRECTGKRVTIEYEFSINGDASDRDQQDVAFGSPNRIFISTRPPHFQPIEH
jgi:hypothetical protein